MPAPRILLHKAVRDLRRRRAQVVAVAVTVACGLALFAATYDAYRNLETSYRQVYDELAFADLWVTGGDTGAVAATARADTAVDGVTTRLQADVPLRLGDTRLQGRVVSVPTGDQPEVNRLLVTDGSYPRDGGEVLLEQHAADHFGLGPGDALGVVVDGRPTDVRIAGVAASAEYLWLARSRSEPITVPGEFAVVFAPRPLAERMAPDTPEQVVLTTTDEPAAARLREAAVAAGALDVYDRSEQASNAALQIDVAGFGELAVLFPVLFLTAAGLAVYVLLARLVQQERSIIGALTANGVGRRAVQRHYATHAFVAVLAGAIPGLVLGSLLGGALTGVYTAELDIPVTATRLRPFTPVIGLGLALVVAAVVAVGPARAAARVLPAEALRPPSPPPGGGRTFIERLLPGRLPTGARIAIRNLVRRPRRAASTAVGVALAAVVVIAAAAMGDSMDAALDRQFSTIDTRDLTAVLDAPATGDAVAALGAIDGVAVAEPADLVDARVAGPGGTTGAEVQLVEQGTALHDFGRPVEPGLVLATGAAEEIGAVEGDTVELTAGGAAGRVPVAAVVEEPLAGGSYLDLATWRRLGGAPPDAVSLAVVEPGALDGVRAELDRRDEVLAVVDHAALEQAAADLLGLFDVFIGIMVAFGVALAVALVFNAITVNVGERTTELTTLRAAGIDRRRLHRWVFGETAIVVAVALLPGLLAGAWIGGQFLGVVDTGAFAIDLVVAPTTWGLVAALVVAAAAVAHVPAFRRLDRLDLAATVRERQT